MKDKGIVSGEAEAEYTWWFWYKKAPDTFANEIGGPLAFLFEIIGREGERICYFRKYAKKLVIECFIANNFVFTIDKKCQDMISSAVRMKAFVPFVRRY